MNCRDFERSWNDVLDAPEGCLPEREYALETHALGCPSCRDLAARYQVLRQAIRSLAPVSAAPSGFVDRCLAAGERPRVPLGVASPWSRLRYSVLPVGAAAVLLLSVLAGLPSGWLRLRHEHGGPAIGHRAVPGPAPLTAALAEATSATWDLARETSAPAARLGREVIDAAVLPETPPALPEAPPVASAADVLQRVGDRVNEGVRPLSGTARNAFGFLLGPALDPLKPAPTL